MIFMTHPKHGAMLVRSAAESVAAQANGWKESTTEQWLYSKVEKPAEPIEPIEAPKKRGRPFKAE
jgi:hypothetical protein